MENLPKAYKIGVIVLRTLLGALFSFASLAYFFKLFPDPVFEGNIKVMMDGFDAAIYLLPIVKVLELLCGISFLSGRLVTLSNIIIFPISVNILMIHVFHLPEGIPTAAFIFVTNCILFYAYRANYKSLLKVK